MTSDHLASPQKSLDDMRPTGWWLIAIFLFLIVGTIGHDPWKQDETYSFGIIYHFYTSHNWLVPINAGTPFMEKPPLYYWTGVLFCKALAGLMPLHDAARLASVFYMTIALVGLNITGRILFEAYSDKYAMTASSLALFLGSLGLVSLSHDMFTDVALLAGTSVALCGMTIIICKPHSWIAGAISYGIGMGTAFLSKGLAIPLIIGVSSVAMVAMLSQLRTANLWKVIAVSAAAAFPFIIIWPVMLYNYSPQLFLKWFWDNNVGRFLGFSVATLGAGNTPGYILYTAIWFAFPAFPLAFYMASVTRNHWKEPRHIIPITFMMVGLVFLMLSASARALYLMPLLPAMTLLAVPALRRMPMPILVKWNQTVRWIVSILALMTIVIWMCLLHPNGPQPFKFLYRDWIPLGYLPQSNQYVAAASACVFITLWGVSFRLNGRHYAHTAFIWFAAMTCLWGVGNSLLLPWADETRSFHPMIADLNNYIDHSTHANACVSRFRLGESVSPMWEYFGKERGLGPEDDFNGNSCPLLLTMRSKSSPVPLFNAPWHLVWKGSRILDDKDVLELYENNTL